MSRYEYSNVQTADYVANSPIPEYTVREETVYHVPTEQICFQIRQWLTGLGFPNIIPQYPQFKKKFYTCKQANELAQQWTAVSLIRNIQRN